MSNNIPALKTLSVIFFSDFKNQPDLSASSFTFGDGITLHSAQNVLCEGASDDDEMIVEGFRAELEDIIRVHGPDVLIAL